jgi:hypothetical protein
MPNISPRVKYINLLIFYQLSPNLQFGTFHASIVEAITLTQDYICTRFAVSLIPD